MSVESLSQSVRHQTIIDHIKKGGEISVNSLCSLLNVSAVTVRKDLTLLETKGLLYRTHGGATASNPYITDKHVTEKEKLKASEKINIATAAVQLIDHDDSIIIGSGTTVQFFARALKPVGRLTVITAALNVASTLNQQTDIDVIVLGGLLRKSSSSGTGLFAEQMLSNFSCSKFFLGVDGIDLDFGLTTTHIMEAQLNRKMIDASQKTIILADSSKFGRRGFGRICGLDEVDHIITDKGLSSHHYDALLAMGIVVSLV